MDKDDLSRLDPIALYKTRQGLLQQLGWLDLEMDKRRQQKRRHVKASELVWHNASDVTPTEWAQGLCQIISPELGFDIHNMHMFMLEIPPHFESDNYHRHGDAIKHYLSGKAVEIIDGQRYEADPGDFIHIPANEWHGTINPYDEPARILAVQQFPGTYTQRVAPFIDQSAG